MDDLISRAEAIELKPEFLNPNVNRETKEQTAIDRAYARGWNSCNTHWIKEIIEDLPSAQPERLTDYSFEESCTDCPAYDTENHRCPRFNQVIRMALKDANLETCEDTISRQAAIDVVNSIDNLDAKARGGICINLMGLPSAQPEQRWIPWDSERLPNDSGTYIVTAYDGAKERVTFAMYQKRLKRWELTGARAYWRVIAWMPLPEPYRAERRTDGSD